MTSTRISCVTRQGTRMEFPLQTLTGPAGRELARREANLWIKSLRLVDYRGETMRQRFRFRDDSLWWFTELYLHKMRRLEQALQTVVALEAAIRDHGAVRIEVETQDPTVHAAALAFRAASRASVEVSGTAPRQSHVGHESYAIGLVASLSRMRPARARVRTSGRRVAAFIHSAFWQAPQDPSEQGHERYVGPVLDAVRDRVGSGDLTYVGVGPRRNFRARRWWDPFIARGAASPLVIPVEALAPRAALADSRALWHRRHDLARAVVSGDDIRAAAVVRGCDLWPVLSEELEHAALLQWPWSARTMDEAGAAIDALEPAVIVTYAEAGGWGRALVLEGRRRGVPVVGVQHGFIYQHWLNYLHGIDEIQSDGADRGCPLPDRTLVFDRYAFERLREAGGFPESTLAITGSPGLDDLADKVKAVTPEERSRLRHTAGVSDRDSLLVLAAKFTEIQAELPALFEAVRGRRAVRLVVKTHPAETADGYRSLAGGAPNIAIVAADTPLSNLLAAADGLVTMNSTVAIDGLVLGLPALVVGLPNNLSPFVDAGVMMGAPPGRLGDALDALLYDQSARERLARRGSAFIERYEMRADGRAAARAAEEILGFVS